MPQSDTLNEYTLTTGDVARRLDLSTSRIADFDDVLQPIRRGSGHRRYRRDLVEAFAATRVRK